MLPFTEFERNQEVDLTVRLDVVHLEGVPDPALVHRSVEQLNRLDRRRIETASPVPVSIREGVVEHGPVRIRWLDSEVDVDTVEPFPDPPELLHQWLVELEPGDALLPDILD